MAFKRRQDVQNAWMVACVGKIGGTVSANPLDAIQECITNTPDAVPPLDELRQRTGTPLPVILNHIATIAFGLSSFQPSALTDGIQVNSSSISQAYHLFDTNWQARSDWSNKVKENKEKAQKRNEGEKGPNLVTKVKESTDLNSHERKLLSCIVDGGQ